MPAAAVQVRVIVYGTNGTGICRDVAVSSLVDLLGTVALATQALQAQRAGQTCAYVVVQHVPAKPSAEAQDLLPPGDIQIINICGRVTHSHTDGCVVARECQPLMTKTRDSFGLRTGLFTTFGNFMTSESNKTTLFRGAKRCTDVLMIAQHIFKHECIESIVMHMLVAKSRLPHPVLVDGLQFEHTLSDSGRWQLTTVSSSEDMTYMKPLHLNLNDGRMTSVLLHIYSSGVVFFFVTCPDTPLGAPDEARVVTQCGEIYTCLASVC
jgi:hypothetical protein